MINKTVLENTAVIPPIEPTQDGYVFKGWFLDLADTTPYDFATLVTKAMTLFSKWEPEQVMFDVTFDTQGGTAIDAQKIAQNDMISKPKDPTRNGYVFKGWYLDNADFVAYDFATPVTKDLTLFAKWELVPVVHYYDFVYDTMGGSSIPTSRVREFDVAGRPSNPSKDGYVFEDWYTDDTYNDKYDFDTPVTGDTTIYAKWITVDRNKKYTITFDTQGGSLIKTVEVLANTAITRPSKPSILGYVFDDWYTDDTFTQIYNFDTKVNEDIVIYAKWIPMGQNKIYTVTFNTQVEQVLHLKLWLKVARWYDAKTLGARFYFNKAIDKDTVVYAQWKKTDNRLPDTGVSTQSITLIAVSVVVVGIGIVVVSIKKSSEEK